MIEKLSSLPLTPHVSGQNACTFDYKWDGFQMVYISQFENIRIAVIWNEEENQMTIQRDLNNNLCVWITRFFQFAIQSTETKLDSSRTVNRSRLTSASYCEYTVEVWAVFHR